jgi:two-component system, NtrC family, sensor histidine kinase HydH
VRNSTYANANALGVPKPGTVPRRIGTPTWTEILFLLFLAGLAVLPPFWELPKQLTLATIAAVQLSEDRLIKRMPEHGHTYATLVKIVLATLLLGYTGDIGINSPYWPIFFVPVVTAATYFGPWGTVLWTALSSAAYCSYLVPALQEYSITWEAGAELATRVLFFFMAAMLVNRFAVEIRSRAREYRQLAEEMADTNRRLAEVQEEARRSERLAALGQMSAGLAHEIRNPLGVIRGSAEMLNRKLEHSNPLASELAGYILSEVNRLSALVMRFLDFARPVPLERRPSDLRQIVDRALAVIAPSCPAIPVTVERQYADELPDVSVDETLCEQVFQNLVLNAYEAMEPAGGTLRVSIAAVRRGPASGVEVAFRDSGVGIPPELSQQIFNPFFTTKKTGVGLGLSVVSKIVDEHRGSLRVESHPGRGACFYVFLPVEGNP